jgi:alkaline phosphatase
LVSVRRDTDGKKLFALAILVALTAWQSSATASSASQTIALDPAPAIILFIGDGMGQAQRTAARWKAVGQGGALAMDALPASGSARTASANNPITDSAAAATALASGVKTNNYMVGLDPDGNPLTTILERAQARGMAVGLITTTQLGHATPSAFAAHVSHRSMMTETARQMLEARVDVLLGDGFFLMVEGGQIDWAGHANDAANVISDTLGLDAAVAVAQTYAASAPNTLLIVTADHETGGMSVSLARSTAPDQDGPFYMPDGTPFYVNWTTTGHTAGDAPTTGRGPWSSLLNGTYENTHIHTVMYVALAPWRLWLPLSAR